MILAGGHFDPKDPRTKRVKRTRLAVQLVHEFQNHDWRGSDEVPLYAKLFEWGYGAEDCSVYNYWDTPHPVKVEGADTRTLVISRNGRAIVAATDYGEGGTCDLTVQLGVLGLSDAAKATNFETGAPMERTAAGSFRFTIDKHDLKVIELQ